MVLKYQIGSGVVSGSERIILFSQEAHLDVATLLSNTNVRHALSLDDADSPNSLLQMMQKWSYWKEKLPQIVEYWFAHHEKDDLRGQLDPAKIRWLPPLMYPNKLICLGANYSDHNAEMGNMTRSKYPFTFLKPPTTTLVGAGETVTLPDYAKMLDWEVELAVIIGKKARNVQGKEAMASIAGYSVLNDISARDWVPKEEQSFMGFDWVMLKGFDQSAPMGPYITPAEFISDPQALNLTLTLNGEVKQNANTETMVFSVLEIVEHLSKVMTLEPGDVIATGTPSGVGFGRKPQEFLQSGDIMVAEIEGLGKLETPMK